MQNKFEAAIAIVRNDICSIDYRTETFDSYTEAKEKAFWAYCEAEKAVLFMRIENSIDIFQLERLVDILEIIKELNLEMHEEMRKEMMTDHLYLDI